MKDTYLKNHNNFILSPITSILKDVVSASAGVGKGIETYPLCDYIMQSVFLKMTGFQEQKMKCICWELATNDYEYRYVRFTQSRLGECSSYKEKNMIYQDLIKQIKKHSSLSFDPNSLDKNQMLSDINTYVKDVFKNTNLLIWAQKSYNDYLSIWNSVSATFFANDEKNLFTGTPQYSLKEMYENHLYSQRNRTAHNTLSYQQNLPTLKTLVIENYKYENYFIYFSLLILIDELFKELYTRYLKIIEEL
jgi:hypothetical protein